MMVANGDGLLLDHFVVVSPELARERKRLRAYGHQLSTRFNVPLPRISEAAVDGPLVVVDARRSAPANCALIVISNHRS